MSAAGMLSGAGAGAGVGVLGGGTSRQGGARLAAEPSTPAATDPRRARDDDRPSRPDATTSLQTPAAERRRTGATDDRTRADDAADRRDEAGAPRFSDLLATPAADAAPPAADAGPEPADTGRDASAPERLLALLSGQWQPAIAPPAPSAGVPAGAMGGLPSATLPATALAVAARPGGEQPAVSSTVSAAAPAGALLPGVPAAAGAAPLPTTDAATGAPAPTAVAPAVTAAATATAASTPEPVRAAAAMVMTVAPETAAALTGDAAAAAIDGVAPLHGSLGPGTVAPAFRTESPLAQQPLALPTNPEAGFDDGFGTHVAWMAGQRIGHAEIRINPEHAGPIDVHVELDGDRVHAGFHSANAEVRQALEASLPRLRELLGQHGLQLGQAEVGQRQASPDRDPARGGGATPRGDGASAADAGQVPAHPVAARLRGLVDAYA